MRLCVPVPCFFKIKTTEDFCLALKKIGELGYDAAEFYHWAGLDLRMIRSAADGTGIELLSMCTSEFRLTSPEHSELWLDGLKRSCEAANILGVKRLITQVGPDTGAPRDAQHAAIVETVIKGLPTLKESGVILMPEPLNVLVNHPGYYLTTAKEGFDIIREINSPNVKLVYDIYHQQVTEGNIIPNVVNNLECIEHLHSAGHPGRHELQYGETDYKVVFSAIDKAGYKGACGLEYTPTADPIESLIKTKEIYG